MDQLNYSRQVLQDLESALEHYSVEQRLIDKAKRLESAVKFMLPDGGCAIDDFEIRGLGDTELRLPFENIALEFRQGPHQKTGKMVKGIVSCQQLPESILITAFAGITGEEWRIGESFELPTKDHTDKTNRTWEPKVPEDGQKKGIAVWVLLFLNALACSNVHIEKIEQPKAGRKIKSKYPFDSYHVLTIDVPRRVGEIGVATGPHRAPREHLRRGHIRRLSDGRRIWVNATVVAAGRGAGVVKKDYALRLAA
jgi:hypothetical protein